MVLEDIFLLFHFLPVHPYFCSSIFVFTHPSDGWTSLRKAMFGFVLPLFDFQGPWCVGSHYVLFLAVETATLSRLLSKLSPHLVRLDFLDIVFRNGIEACCQATSSNAHKASFLLSQLYTTLQRCDALGSTDNTQVCPVGCYGNQAWC